MSPQGNGHMQEITTTSFTETVIDHGKGARPTVRSKFTDEVFVASSNPDSLPEKHTRSVRKTTTLDPRLITETIPPEHSHRTLILCFDGTGDQFDADNSNIVKLVSLLKKDDRTKQMVYYQAGIGTYTSPQIATPLISRLSKLLDGMFAWNLDAHVMGGYDFLMQNYTSGDKICIFGFSRGAYTARSLAGMLHKVGLLPACNLQQVPFAYKMYTRDNDDGWQQSNAFKKTFSIDVSIEFLGVWDTVDSVGLIPKRLPFTTSNTIVRTFRHAVSLDERRAKFKANLWNRPNDKEEKLGVPASPHVDLPSSQDVSPTGSPVSTSVKRKSKRGDLEGLFSDIDDDEQRLSQLESMYAGTHLKHGRTDIEEVWFAGCHCDVGGGSVGNATRYSLARIPLRWMIRECFKANTGMMFDTTLLREIGLDPMSLYPFVTPRPPLQPNVSSRIEVLPSFLTKFKQSLARFKQSKNPDLNDKFDESSSSSSSSSEADSIERDQEHEHIPIGTEEEEELRDALSPVYDQLELARFWWLLELMPLQLRYQKGDNTWVSFFGLNKARPRFIPRQKKNGLKVHRSVKLRMEAEYAGKPGKKYCPRAKFSVEPTWVD